MTTRVKSHRASAQRRRAALLAAAADLSAEVGAGAVTHRAVAARAGVPLSTTSYFFSSIDELVTEALRVGANARVSDFDAAEAVAVLGGAGSISTVLDQVVEQALSSSRTAEGSQVEYYLAAGRQPELHDEASATVARFAGRVERQLSRTGAVRAEEVAWAITALGDGAMLHRLAGIDTDHRERLRAGLRILVAAAMLTDDEIDDLLGRYGTGDAAPADGEGGAPAAAGPDADLAHDPTG